MQPYNILGELETSRSLFENIFLKFARAMLDHASELYHISIAYIYFFSNLSRYTM
jgi:hypothetical protein